MNEELDRIAHLIGQGRPDLAATEAAAARLRFPQAAEPARLHGIALLQLGGLDNAIAALETASALDPQSIETLCNLASALLARSDFRAALLVMQSAQLLAPDHPAVLNGLGNARRANGDAAGAKDAYLAATRAAPNHLGAWLNLAAVELALGNSADCERIARMILRQMPHAQASLLLAQALVTLERLAEAAEVCIAGSRAAPDDANLAYQLGQIADEQKNPALAAEAHTRALTLNPHLSGALAQLVFIKRQLCEWTALDAWSDRLRAAVNAGASDVAPFGFLAEPATAAEQLQCATHFANRLGRAGDPLRGRDSLAGARRSIAAPLRIGFASNGFGNHPTGLLTVAFFEALRQHEVEFHLFASAPADGSPIQQRLRKAASEWHDIASLPPRTMAERIAAADIEILVDLRVWGGGNISEALALRPAPVQINWLAYPGTSGASWIDYMIADRHVLPARLHTAVSEQVALLPRCFQPSDPGRAVGNPPPRGECGLPDTGTVYACFNNSYKLDPRSVQRMLRILAAVPGSVLWLLSGPGTSDANLRAVASAAGIDPQRLVFMPKQPHLDYLARYRHADLFLDTAIYNAHTTASDAIWAGCPVLTTPGQTFAARVAGSLNHHLGLAELNVDDDERFVEAAIRIGTVRSVRDALHARLAQLRGSSDLFDMDGFALDFIALLGRMANRYRNGHPPASLVPDRA